jgi:YD repeat-containing protein
MNKMIDPMGRVSTYSYYNDGSRRLQAVQTVLGTTTTTYDARTGEIGTVQDANLNITTMGYDSAGRMINRITRPIAVNVTETWIYNTAGLLDTHIDNASAVDSTYYDSRGLIRVYVEGAFSPAARATATTYDDIGRNILVRDVSGGSTRYAYSSSGPSATVTTTDPKGNNSFTYYDFDGERIRMVDNLALTTSQAYNSRGWPTTMTDARGHNWVTNYDVSGNVTSSTDPLGHGSVTDYDELGRVHTVTDARGNVTTTSYWRDGRVMDVTDPRRYTTHTTYDLANRQITIQNTVRNTLGVVIFQQNTTQTLDAVGNVVSVTDPLMHATTVPVPEMFAVLTA